MQVKVSLLAHQFPHERPPYNLAMWMAIFTTYGCILGEEGSSPTSQVLGTSIRNRSSALSFYTDFFFTTSAHPLDRILYCLIGP